MPQNTERKEGIGMTIRHKQMISDRLYKIMKITDFSKKEPELTFEVLKNYRVESVYQDINEICGYMPDSLLDEIVEDLEKC